VEDTIKMIEKLVVLVFAMLLFGVVSVLAMQNNDNSGEDIPLRADAPIQINNDAELASQASVGTGSESDPYVIENYNIDVGTDRSGIYIGNTTKHLIIDNCEIYNVSSALGNWGAASGISIINASNVTVKNVYIHGSKYYGLYITASSHIVVERNRIENNTLASSSYGIYVEGIGSDILVRDNFLYNTNPHGTGIYFHSLDYAMVINNTIAGFRTAGIDLHYSSRTTLWENSMYGCSISITGNSLKYYEQRIPVNNTANDKPVYYYLNESMDNASINPENPGEIIMVNVSNAALSDMNISGTSISYLIALSHNIHMSNASAYDTGSFAYDFVFSEGITVENSSVRRSLSTGVYVYQVNDMILSNVTVREAGSNGVYAYYSYRLIFFNLTLERNYYGLSVYNSYYEKNQYTVIENSRFENMTQFSTKFMYALNIMVNGSYFSYGTYAIWLDGFDDDAEITNNTVLHAFSYGIYGSHSERMDVENNTIEGCSSDGIYMQYQSGAYVAYNYVENTYGTEFMAVNSSVIMNNTIRNSEKYGLAIYGGASHFGYSLISGNAIYDSTNYGIYLNGTTANVLHGNILSGNRGSGSSYDPAKVQAWDDYPGNSWNTSYGGNYWYDFTSPDNDGDGIVDDPYSIDGPAGSQDGMPLADSPSVPEFSGMGIFALLAVLTAVFLLRRR